MAWDQIIYKFFEVIGTGAIGFGTGYYARKQAAKTEMVADLRMIKEDAAASFILMKTEYVALADYTREELASCRLEHLEAKAEIASLKASIALMSNKINELTSAMHNIIETPKPIRK